MDKSGKLDTKSYRRIQGRDDDGISISSSHDNAKSKLKAGNGVAELKRSAVENLVDCPISQTDDQHGLIKNLPFDLPQNYDLVMHFADKLVSLSQVKLERWRSED